jgi:hypothetical protein
MTGIKYELKQKQNKNDNIKNKKLTLKCSKEKAIEKRNSKKINLKIVIVMWEEQSERIWKSVEAGPSRMMM